MAKLPDEWYQLQRERHDSMSRGGTVTARLSCGCIIASWSDPDNPSVSEETIRHSCVMHTAIAKQKSR